jgi:hypothetical protein
VEAIKTILDVVEYLESDGSFTAEDSAKIRAMIQSGEKKLKITFDAYLAVKDFDDLADSLFKLLGYKKGERKTRLIPAATVNVNKQTN